jgi:hypothetical protein
VEEVVADDVGKTAFECSECFVAGVALGEAFDKARTSGWQRLG